MEEVDQAAVWFSHRRQLAASAISRLTSAPLNAHHHSLTEKERKKRSWYKYTSRVTVNSRRERGERFGLKTITSIIIRARDEKKGG